MAQRRLGIVQNFTLTATAQVSSVFAAQTRNVLITSNTTGVGLGGAFILISNSTSTVVSSSNGTLFPAPWVEQFEVSPGQQIQVIEATTAHGMVSVTEMQ